jgi:flagellar hook-length control protein FliK
LPSTSWSKEISQQNKRLADAIAMACALLMSARDNLDQQMIAQPIVSTPSTKPPASQAQPASPNGFLALLSPDTSSLLNMSQTSTVVPSNAAPAANSNKPNSSDSNSNPTPYINAPVPTTIVPTAAVNQATSAAAGDQTAIAQAAANSLGLNGNAIPSNPVLPPSDPQAGNSGDAAAGAPSTNGTSNATGNSTGFGANVDARVAAGAPIYASQPNASMATVPPHLLNAAASPTQPAGSIKPGDDGTQKIGADNTGAEPVLPAVNPSTASAALHPAHGAVTDQTQAGGTGTQDGNAPSANAPATDGSNAGTNATDTSAASSSLAAQSGAPLSAPAQVNAVVHTAAPYVPVGEQVALNLKQALAADNNEIRIQLKPASLGTIDVKLNLTQDGRVSAVISADRSDTLNMLKQDSATLQQSLRDAGLNADGNSLSFNLRGDAQSFAQNSSQGGFGRGGNGGGNAYAADSVDTLGAADPTISSQSYHTGSLDIEV